MSNIKSSKCSLKFTNANKLNQLHCFIIEYQRVCRLFIDIFWHQKKIPILISKKTAPKIETWLSKRAIQCAGKQASGVVRGTQQKQKQRLFIYNKLIEEGKLKHARKLKKFIDNAKISKPDLSSIQPELDSRFIRIELENSTSFDMWVNLGSLGNKIKFSVPISRTKHFNKLFKIGKLKAGARLGNSFITFNFELPEPKVKETGSIIGIDIGSNKVITSSSGHVSQADKHGWDLSKIQDKLSRRKKGSKGFLKAQDHRKNHVHWCINQLNLDKVKCLRLENIKHLRKYKRTSRKLSHWNYAIIFDKLKDYCTEQDVLVESVSPTYTSQRCSECGWTRKANRRGSLFKCDKCSFECDADLNASCNISFGLPCVSKKERLKGYNRAGFYYASSGQEPIVSDVLKGHGFL